MFSLFTKCFCKKKEPDIKRVNPNKYKGKIFIGYCRGHETMTFIIRLNHYKEKYKRILSIVFRCNKFTRYAIVKIDDEMFAL